MDFLLKLKCDNAAFWLEESDFNFAELARQLHATATRVGRGDCGGKIFDSNGNAVGEYTLEGARK